MQQDEIICCTYAYVSQADTMAMDTDSNADEEGADESRDGQDGPSPPRTYEDAVVHCAAARAASAPCSPSGTRPGPGPSCSPGSGLDSVSFQKAGERPSSLPPSSPRALAHNDWAYDSAVCPTERQHPGMQRDKGIHTARHSLICTRGIMELSNIVSCACCMRSPLDMRSGWEPLTTGVINCGVDSRHASVKVC